jgi:nitroreductase/FMN reductase [NAD(P)H]
LKDTATLLQEALAARFGEDLGIPPGTRGLDELLRIATQVSHRRWADTPIAPGLLRLLAACALSAPSKSDLQQTEIVEIRDPAKRDAAQALIPSMPWIRGAPAFLVFCGSGRRLRRLFARRGSAYPNEHLDGFFNPTVDASLVMMNFMRAASAAGLVCCPISAVRDRAPALAALLALPEHVFPVAGLCVGFPVETLSVNPRIALSASLHIDRIEVSDSTESACVADADHASIDASVADYDRRWLAARDRRSVPPPSDAAAPRPAWSDEKLKQFSTPQHADWGGFVRSAGFDPA